MRALRLAVEDPLTAEPRRQARPLDRQDEAAAEIVAVDPAGQADRLPLQLGGDAGEQHGVGRADLVRRQAVDPLDVEVALGHREGVDRLALGGAHGEGGGVRGVAVEADHEQPAGRRRPHRGAVHQHLRPRRRADDGEAALDQPAGKLQAGGRGARLARRGHGSDGGQAAGQGQDRPAVQPAFLSFSSRHRWVASFGLA